MENEIREFLPVISPKKGDKELEESLLEIASVHSGGTGLIGINNCARKFYSQKPFDIKKRTIYVDEKDKSYFEDINKMIKNCLEPFTLLIRNKNTDLLGAFFVPEGYPNNPHIRFLEF